jgi:hypothetical protein
MRRPPDLVELELEIERPLEHVESGLILFNGSQLRLGLGQSGAELLVLLPQHCDVAHVVDQIGHRLDEQ